jgi:hypothetical protein
MEDRMKKLLVLVSMAAVVAVLVAGLSGAFGTSTAPAVYASRLAGISGNGETGIQVQNLDASQDAQITASFYPQAGGNPIDVQAPATKAGGAANFYLPNIPTLPDGSYAAIVNSDRQIAAIARTDWPQSGGAATYSNVLPSTDVAVPLAVKNYYTQCSLVSVQNTNTSSQATATVEVYATGSAAPAVSPSFQIPPGTSKTVSLCDDAEFESLPNSFLGSIRVKSQNEIGVQSFIDLTESKQAVYAFEGVPVENAASDLYAPLFRSRQFVNPRDPATSAKMDTGISVVNTSPNPVQVTVEFYGADKPDYAAECRGHTFTQGPFEIPASSSAVFYQGPGAQAITGNKVVPDNCVGSAKISATGGTVLAIVNDSLNFTVQSAAYNAVSAAQTGTTVALPLFRSNHTSWRLYTGISAMNAGTGPASISIEITDSEGNVTSGKAGMQQSNVGANETALFWPGDFANENNWTNVNKAYGSATITSDQPLAVIVNDFSLSAAADSSTYNGINATAQ